MHSSKIFLIEEQGTSIFDFRSSYCSI